MVTTLISTLPWLRRLRLAWLSMFAVLLLSSCGDDLDDATKRAFTIGLITNNPNGLKNIQGFRDGLQALGYREGENAIYLHSGKPTRKSELVPAIRAMIDNKAQLIFTAGTPTGVAARKATRESLVPVVFGVIADPIASGVMTDLNRPGGNMTGVMLSQNQARRLELLHTVVPRVRRILVPYNPDDAAPTSAVAQIEGVAAALELEIVHARARSDDQVTALLADFPDDVDAVFMLPDSTVNRRAKELLAAATERKLPVSGPSTAQVEAGATMSLLILAER